MHEIARANASSPIARASSDRAPVEAAIVAAPKAAGIAAAANDWKTSSSAMKSSGRAMSSARWIADSELRVPSLDSSGMPVTVARTGLTVRRSTRLRAASLRRAISARLPEIVSSKSALLLDGRSADCPEDADHGLSTRTPGRFDSAVTSLRPWRLTSARGPRRRTGTVAESPKLPPISARAREDSEFETSRPPGDRRSSIPSPATPSSATTTSQTDSTAHGYVAAKRVGGGTGRPCPPSGGCMMASPLVNREAGPGRLVVHASARAARNLTPARSTGCGKLAATPAGHHASMPTDHRADRGSSQRAASNAAAGQALVMQDEVRDGRTSQTTVARLDSGSKRPLYVTFRTTVRFARPCEAATPASPGCRPACSARGVAAS